MKRYSFDNMSEEQIEEMYDVMNNLSPEEHAKIAHELWPGKTDEELTAMAESLDEVMGAEHTEKIIVHILNTGRHTLRNK